jgi:hypothetical protein
LRNIASPFFDIAALGCAVSANPKKIISRQYSSVNEIRPTKSGRVRPNGSERVEELTEKNKKTQKISLDII